jgi:hypothetical protein
MLEQWLVHHLGRNVVDALLAVGVFGGCLAILVVVFVLWVLLNELIEKR